MKRLLLVSVLLLSVLTSGAQMIHGRDSLCVEMSSFRPVQLAAPAALGTAGILIHCFGHGTVDFAVRDWAQKVVGEMDVAPFDDYIQYAPLVMDLGLGLMGARSRHGFTDRVIEAALANLVCGLVSGPSKEIIGSLRPNGADTRSFPSGHTDFSFTNAALVQIEYGWGWGAGAYGIAGIVGVMRVVRNWHWFSDVLAGASLGILSGYTGMWLLEPVKSLLGIRTDQMFGRNLALLPSVDPMSGAFSATFSMTF